MLVFALGNPCDLEAWGVLVPILQNLGGRNGFIIHYKNISVSGWVMLGTPSRAAPEIIGGVLHLVNNKN